jgi:hypothetical protein
LGRWYQRTGCSCGSLIYQPRVLDMEGGGLEEEFVLEL